MQRSIWKPTVVATAISGTLDILFAMLLTVAFGREIPNMLRYVASGPFPDATNLGIAGAVIGLLVHFALMAIMAAIYISVARHRPHFLAKPVQWGILYGLATYFVMNWMVVPLRFHPPLPPKPLSIATQLFAHIVLVGLPFAFVARRYLRPDHDPKLANSSH